MDMASLNNLLSFLEAVFNGGSDFNEPIRRCLDRMAEAEWANSDILLVSDGELRQPGPEVPLMADRYMCFKLGPLPCVAASACHTSTCVGHPASRPGLGYVSA